jgi:hypothetical protein
MPKFLVEVPHGESKEACERAVAVFLATGSHFVVNADWGCADNVHKAWIIADLDSKQEAVNLLPPAFRKDATVVLLENYSPADAEEILKKHSGS